MGTKNNPGDYDCYAAAEPDEPMFVLLGRDKHAPMLVRMWGYMRELDKKDFGKISEAYMLAVQMEQYRRERQAAKKE